MAKTPEKKRAPIADGQPVGKVDYVKKMYEILREERKAGLVGIRFCGISGKGGSDLQMMAGAFCETFAMSSL